MVNIIHRCRRSAFIELSPVPRDSAALTAASPARATLSSMTHDREDELTEFRWEAVRGNNAYREA